jgi:outer membrane protein OmpA-like peptidoglycan-associated protein
MKLSQQRADALKTAFSAIGSQIAGAEGYGSEYAKYAASDPDSLRAKDRNMSIRFVK